MPPTPTLPAVADAPLLPLADDIARSLPRADDPAAVAAHGRHLAALGLIHLRHAAAPRAMVLGLAAMSMGDLRPRTVLMVAEALLQAGDPAQALTALERFDGGGAGLDASPSRIEDAARHYLAARAMLRQGRMDEARAALDLALAHGGLGDAADVRAAQGRNDP